MSLEPETESWADLARRHPNQSALLHFAGKYPPVCIDSEGEVWRFDAPSNTMRREPALDDLVRLIGRGLITAPIDHPIPGPS